MTPEEEAEIDWSLCTWKGSRRSQHQDFYSLSFRRKMEVIEEMNEFAQSFLESRKRRGLPYIDPATGAVVPGTVSREGATGGRASEEPPERPK